MHRQIANWIVHRWAKWVVLVLALLIVGVLGGSFGSKLTSVQKNDIADWLPKDSQSAQVIKKSAAFADPDAVPAIVLFVNPQGLNPSDYAHIAEASAELSKVENVSEVAGPIPSKDGKAAQLFVTLKLGSDGWNALPDSVDAIKKAATTSDSDLEVYVGGPAAFGADQANAFGSLDTTLLFTAVAVVIVLLLLTYRSPILWIIPLFAGLASVSTAQGLVYLLAKYAGLTVNGQSAGILSVLVLGASIDYALLLVARYREELHTYEDRHEAMAHALHRAAPAILASGLTVMLGLLCLTMANLGSTAGLGPVGAVGIGAALLMMLVLLPALLVIVGRWVFWPFVPRFGTPERSQTGFWAKVGNLIAKAPRAVWITTTFVLLLLTLGGLQLNANGLSNADQFTTTQPSVTAEAKIAEHYPAGEGTPMQIIVDSEHAAAVRTAVQDVTNVSAVSEPIVRNGTALLTAELSVPSDSDKAEQAVRDARAAAAKVDGSKALVGGQTALTLDVNEAAGADNRLIIPVVLLVVFVVLALLLRSLAAPLMLLGTVVLSFFAAVGLSALVFRHVLGFAGTDPSFLLYAFVFLVALGIDYNIFLMTRVREEAMRVGTRKGTLIALAATGGVITSAGLVLAGTFSALAVLPVVVLAELGFVVAVGVLMDTIIVRSVLVTALNLDFGRHIWWPSQLARADAAEPEAEAPPKDPTSV